MNTYLIQCAEINGLFKGYNHEYAFKRAVRTKRPKSLAMLFRFKEYNEEGILLKGVWKYQSTLSVLNK